MTRRRITIWAPTAALAAITLAWLGLALTAGPGDDRPGRWAAVVFTAVATVAWPWYCHERDVL